MCDDIDHGGRRCPSSDAAGQRARRARTRERDADARLQAFIGATPFRPESGDLMRMSSRPSYYDNDEWIEYDDSLHLAAERHGVEIIDSRSAAGLWEGESEPAGAYIVRAERFEDITAWAGEIAGRYNQDGVMAGYFTPEGPDQVFSFAGDHVSDERVGAVLETLRSAGVPGGRLYDGRLEIAVQADSPLPPAAVDLIARRLQTTPSVSPAHVAFVDATDEYRKHAPIKEIQMLRQNYADAHGLPLRQRMPHLTTQDDIAAARAYDAARHEPKHPRVARSYRYFRQHIAAQWNMLVDAGYTFDPWQGDQEQPYVDSADMLADLRDNKHLSYFRTEVSQHTNGALPPDHPMASMVTVTMPSGERRRMVANDVFRAVHDALAHSEGHQFGPFGEKRAWWTHRSCLPREARLALWNETRAQNCWTNAGPHMTTVDETGATRLLRHGEGGWLPLTQRPYAEQKTVRVHPSLL
jgi:hypothetical protein